MKRYTSNLRTFALSFRTWCVVAVSVFVLLPAFVWAGFEREIMRAYSREFLAPAWQERYGFEQGFISAPRYAPGPTFGITSVRDGGAFAAAGIEPGDLVAGFKHGFEEGFYWVLSQADVQGTAQLEIVRPRTGEREVVSISTPPI